VSVRSLLKSVYRISHNVFRKDIGRKLMALFLALLVWSYVAQKVVDSDTRRLNIRLVTKQVFLEEFSKEGDTFFIILPDNLMEVSRSDQTTLVEDQILEVNLSGPKDLLPTKLIGKREVHVGPMGRDGVNVRDIPITIDKSCFEDLGLEEIRASFNPAEIKLTVAMRDELIIQLTGQDNLHVEGELPEEFEMEYDRSRVQFDPNPVTILGPAPEIEKIRANPSLFKLRTIRISQDFSSGFSYDLGPSREMEEKKVTLLTQKGNMVKVRLNLQEKDMEITLFSIPLLLLRNGQPLDSRELNSITPDKETVDVVMRGRPSLFASRTKENLRKKIKLVVDLEDRTDFPQTFDISIWRWDLEDSIRVNVKDKPSITVRKKEGAESG